MSARSARRSRRRRRRRGLAANREEMSELAAADLVAYHLSRWGVRLGTSSSSSFTSGWISDHQQQQQQDRPLPHTPPPGGPLDPPWGLRPNQVPTSLALKRAFRYLRKQKTESADRTQERKQAVVGVLGSLLRLRLRVGEGTLRHGK